MKSYNYNDPILVNARDYKIKGHIDTFMFNEDYILSLVLKEIERTIGYTIPPEKRMVEWMWHIDPTSSEYVYILGLKMRGRTVKIVKETEEN